MDSYIYFKLNADSMLFVAVYEDDLIVFSNNIDDRLEKVLSVNFKMKNR